MKTRISAKPFLPLEGEILAGLPNLPGGRGRGALSIFVQRGCAIFRASFSPIFCRTGNQKKAIFLEPVVKTCQKRKFCSIGLSLSPIVVFWGILFTVFLEKGII